MLEPPLLGLRWAPTARGFSKNLARADRAASPERWCAVDDPRQPPPRDALLAQKDKQIRWLKELALDAADEESSACHPAAANDQSREQRALTSWRLESARAARAKLELALCTANARCGALAAQCEQLEEERASLALEVVHEADTVSTLLELRANTWRLASAARAWRSLARHGPIGRRADRARLRRGVRELTVLVVLADVRAAAAARSDATLRRSWLRAALARLRAHTLAAARTRAALARSAGLYERAAQRRAVRTLDLAVRRAAKDGVAAVRAEADELSSELQANADAALAHAAQLEELARWRRGASARLRATEALIGSAGLEALIDALVAMPSEGGVAHSGASALALCATTIDALRVRLAGADAALAAERALGATAVQRKLRAAALAELRVQGHAFNALHARALRQAIERYARAQDARWSEREAQLGRVGAWRAAHAAELCEGTIALALR
jgi:hypothetical protein